MASELHAAEHQIYKYRFSLAANNKNPDCSVYAAGDVTRRIICHLPNLIIAPHLITLYNMQIGSAMTI